MPTPTPTLNFPHACLTPLHPQDLRALEALTAGWSMPDPAHGITATTLGPAAYRRLRLRRAALCAGYALAVIVIPCTLIVTLLILTDDPAWHSGRGLTVVAWFLAGGLVLIPAAAAIGWHATGGKHRVTAGAEPENRLIFTATPDGLTVTNAAGWRRTGPWRRWRFSHVRSEVIHMRRGRMYLFEAATLVHYADDGTPDGRVTLDPITLANGRETRAPIIALICLAVTDTRPA